MRYATKFSENGVPRVIDIAAAMGFESSYGLRVAEKNAGQQTVDTGSVDGNETGHAEAP